MLTNSSTALYLAGQSSGMPSVQIPVGIGCGSKSLDRPNQKDEIEETVECPPKDIRVSESIVHVVARSSQPTPSHTVGVGGGGGGGAGRGGRGVEKRRGEDGTAVNEKVVSCIDVEGGKLDRISVSKRLDTLAD